jgi:hypothetical protein
MEPEGTKSPHPRPARVQGMAALVEEEPLPVGRSGSAAGLVSL